MLQSYKEKQIFGNVIKNVYLCNLILKGMTEEQYMNFDEYIRQGDPSKREKADAWRVAIGLQAVDGLKTSAYLQELARRNIEGETTIDEVKTLIDQYYAKKKQKSGQLQDKHKTSTPQVPPKYPASWGNVTDNTRRLVKAVGYEQLSIKTMLAALKLKDRKNFISLFLNPAIAEGFVQMLYPDKPHHPRQKYLLTAKGTLLYNEIIANH